MKALNMSLSRKPVRVPLAGGICRKPLSPERIRELNRIKYEQRKAEKQLKEWEAFCKTLVKNNPSLPELVKSVREKHPSS